MSDRDKSASPLRRLGNAALGGVVAGVGIALWESLRLSDGVSRAPLLFGTQAFVWVGVALAVGLFLLLVAPGAPRGVAALFRSRRNESAAAIVLAGLALPPFMIAMSEASFEVFVSDGSSGGRGAVAALVSLSLCVVVALVGKAMVPRVARWLPGAFTPGHALVCAVLFVGVALAGVVALGDPTGGAGAFDRLGVLGREELDLTIPACLALTALLAAQATVWLKRVPAFVGALVALVAVLGLVPAGRGFDDGALLAEVEQGTRVARTSLRVLQRLTDRDKDGFGAGFGGGDCNDQNAEVFPGAVDERGNGIDEDCSGADEAPRAALTETVTTASATGSPSAAPSAVPSALVLDPNLNVILISVDTLRWDLGYMGYERPITPKLDALASRSVIYEKAYALASYTGKSIGPTLIGRYPSETQRGGWLHFNRFPPSERMLQERLQAAGIRTISVQGHWYFDEGYGLGRGFDVLDMSAAPEEEQEEGDKTVNSKELTDAAIRQLEDPKNTAGRFFLWVHYLDPHANYVKHPDFDFGNDERARYDGEIAFTDHHIGRLLDAVEARGLAGKTAVIFTSDHGEAFGEHGMMRHGFEVWDEIVRVPLVVHVPGRAPGRVTARRSLIDLTPTVLELFGVTVEPAGFLRGTSWLADLANPGAAAARPVFIDMPAGPYNGDRQAFIENDIKITTSNTRTMGVFDLAKDPGEKNNLMRDAALAQRVHARFLEFRRELDTVKVTPP